jgi:hypothetical protein
MIQNNLWRPPPGTAKPERHRTKPPPTDYNLRRYIPDMDCNACPRRKQLCSKRLCIAAIRYADQDYVGQREHCFSYIDGCLPEQIPEDHNAFLMAIPVTKSLIAKLYFHHHLKIMQIADITYRSHPYISKVIAQCRTQLRTIKHQKHPKSTILYKG